MSALTRAQLVGLVLEATTDAITNDEHPEWGVRRPNLLVEGCRSVRAFGALGYAQPEAAARIFAGRIADAVLAALDAPQAKPRPQLRVVTL